MHAKAFPLSRKGPKRLLLTWETGRRNVRLYFDGDLLNPDGRDYANLPDRSQIQFSFNWLGQPRLYRNYRPLPGSADDPVSRIPLAAGVCFVDGTLFVLSTLLDLIGYAPEGEQLHSVALTSGTDPISVIYLIAGLVLIVCGILVALRMRLGLWVAMAIYGIDTFLVVLALLQGVDVWLGLGFHVVSLYLMFRAFAGFDMLEAEAAEDTIATMRKAKPPVQALPESAGAQPAPKPLYLTPISSLSLTDPLLQQVETHLQLGNLAQAKAILANFMRDNPTNGYGWYLASFVFSEHKRQIEALERSLRYNPDLKQAKERLAALQANAVARGRAKESS